VGQQRCQHGGGFYNAGMPVSSTLSSITIRQSMGPAIYNSGSLELYHNTIRDNAAPTDGGGIYNNGSNLVVNSTIVYNNTAGNTDGSGIFSAGGPPTWITTISLPMRAPVLQISDHPRFLRAGLVNIWYLRIDSPNIDRADPALVETGNDPLVDYDANIRPGQMGITSLTIPLYGYESDIGA
jgi:hypothetical protein